MANKRQQKKLSQGRNKDERNYSSFLNKLSTDDKKSISKDNSFKNSVKSLFKQNGIKSKKDIERFSKDVTTKNTSVRMALNEKIYKTNKNASGTVPRKGKSRVGGSKGKINYVELKNTDLTILKNNSLNTHKQVRSVNNVGSELFDLDLKSSSTYTERQRIGATKSLISLRKSKWEELKTTSNFENTNKLTTKHTRAINRAIKAGDFEKAQKLMDKANRELTSKEIMNFEFKNVAEFNTMTQYLRTKEGWEKYGKLYNQLKEDIGINLAYNMGMIRIENGAVKFNGHYNQDDLDNLTTQNSKAAVIALQKMTFDNVSYDEAFKGVILQANFGGANTHQNLYANET